MRIAWATGAALLLGAPAVLADLRGDCYQSENPDLSIRACTAVIGSNPRPPFMAYTFRGLAYTKKGEIDRAIAEYSLAIEIYPQLPDGYVYRGGAHAMKGDYERALADLNKAIEMAPRWSEGYYMRGRIYSQRKDRDRAIADFGRALAIDPKHRGSLDALKRLAAEP